MAVTSFTNLDLFTVLKAKEGRSLNFKCLLTFSKQQRKSYIAVAVQWLTSHECWKNVECSHYILAGIWKSGFKDD